MRIERASVRVDGLEIGYLEGGEGLPVVLIHGWPTSSFLWRNVMPAIAEHRRVIAVDLPGFGRSSKPLDATYGFEFFRGALDGFASALGIERFGLVVHDLGGPVGLYWASQRPADLERLAILNTIVYPELSWAVKGFVLAAKTPGLRSVLTSRWGLERALRFGMVDPGRLREDAVEGTCSVFARRDARAALLKAACGLGPGGLAKIAAWLPTVEVPVRAIYGVQDRILPDIARTVRRLQDDLPQIEVTALPDCGHFLQEEQPEEIGALLAAFFADERQPLPEM